MSVMTIEQVREYLPHREPFLFVDRVLELQPKEFIKGLKNVTMNEPFFTGHFPNHPVMPGVLIVEALAQVAAILTFVSEGVKPDGTRFPYFVGIDGARFRKPVFPGDQLILEARLARQAYRIWKYQAKAYVNGQLVTEAELMCTEKQM